MEKTGRQIYEPNICRYAVFLLEKNFSELKGKIKIYVLCGEKSNDSITGFEEGYEILAEKTSVLKDSRVQGWGKEKVVCWVFLAKGTSEAAMALAELVLDELQEKFTDYLYIERLESISSEWIKGKELSDRRREYFFGFIQDGEKLRNECVKKILKKNQLPPWQLLVQISSRLYEKRPLNTRLYFIPDDTFSDVPCVRLEGDSSDEKWEEKYKLSEKNLRTVRKLMEAAHDGQGILVSMKEYVIRKIAGQEDCEKIARVCIHFQGHLNWKVIIEGKDVLWYRGGEYQFPALGEAEPEHIQKLNKMYLDDVKIENIKKIIEKLSRQPHGTSVVFIDERSLKDEIERLAGLNRLHKVKAFQLMEQEDGMIMGITAIDGALMANLDGMCCAIGAILDGDAVVRGDPGRGSRYNSLANYIARFKQKKKAGKGTCFAVIFSEDERIDIETAK